MIRDEFMNSEPTAQMLEVLYIFQRCWILVIFCQIFVKVKKLHKIRSKVDKNCAIDWADIFKTPVLL